MTNYYDTYQSKSEAAAIADKIDNGGVYYLRHGEYARPDYRAQRYGDGWGVKKVTYFFPGTYNSEQSGRVNGARILAERIAYAHTLDAMAAHDRG